MCFRELCRLLVNLLFFSTGYLSKYSKQVTQTLGTGSTNSNSKLIDIFVF